MAQPTTSNLPPDVLAFIRIPINQFVAIKTFLSDNPGFLHFTRASVFDDAALLALKANDRVLLQQCSQRRIIAVQCKVSTQYLDSLIKNEPRVTEHFYESWTRYVARM